MSERKVVFSAIAKFLSVRREADETRRSIERLAAEEEAANKKSTTSSTEASKADQRRSKTLADVQKGLKNAAAAQADYTAAAEKEVQAGTKQNAVQRALTSARTRHTSAMLAQFRAQEQVRKSTEALSQAELRHGRSSTQARTATLALTAALASYESALRKVATVERTTGSGGGGLINVFRALRGEFGGAASAAANAAFGLTSFAAKAQVVITAINFLISALSGLVGGLGAVIGTLGPMIGILGTLPQLLLGLGGTIGTVLGAFNGIGGALQAYKKQQDAATASTGAGAKATAGQTAAQKKAKAATDALRKAQRALNKAQKEAEKNIRDLQKASRNADLEATAANMQADQKQQTLDALKANGASPEQIAAAQQALGNAQAKAGRAAEEARAAQLAYNDAQDEGVAGNKKVIAAQKKVDKAQKAADKANEAAAKAAQNAAKYQTAAAKAANAYQDALNKLTPAGRKFVEVLISMQDRIKGLRDAAQEALLPGLTTALEKIRDSDKLWDVLTRGVEGFGKALGEAANKVVDVLLKGENLDILDRVMKSNTKLAGMFGDAAANLAQFLLNVLDAARPLTEWLGKLVVDWTALWSAQTSGEKGQKKLTDFFEKTRDVLSQWGQLIGNVAGALRATFGAGYDSGMKLLGMLTDAAGKWEDWAKSTEGQNRLKAWFEAVEPTVIEIGRLIRDLTVSFFKMGENKGTADLLKQIRTELLPAVSELFNMIGQSLGPKIVTLLTDIVKLFTNLGGGTGGLSVFIDTLDLLVSTLVKITDKVPFASEALGIFFASFAAFKAVKFAGKITGITGALGGLTKGLKGAAGGGGIKGFIKGITGSTGALEGELAKDAEKTAALGGMGTEFGKTGKKAGIFRRAIDGTKKAVGAAAKGIGKFAAFLGKGLMRGLTGAAKGVGRLGATLGRGLVKGLTTTAKLLSKVVGVIGKVLMRLVGIVSKALMMIGRAMLANPWLLLVAALVIAAILIYKNWDKIKKIIKKAWDWIYAKVLKPVGKFFKKYLIDPLVWTAKKVAEIFGKVKDVIMSAINWVIDFVKQHWDMLAILGGPLVFAIAQIIKHWDTIKKVFAVAIKVVKALIRTAWSVVKTILINPLKAAWEGIKWVWDKIKQAFSTATKLIKSALHKAWDVMKSLIVDPIQAGWDLLKGVWDGIGRGFDSLWEGIKTAAGKFKDAMSGIWDKIKSVFATPVEWVVNTVLDSWIIGNVNKVLDFVGISNIPKVGPVHFARGGTVPGEGNRDSVPAMLMPGEFVLRKDAVKRIGKKRLDLLNTGKTKKFANGGEVMETNRGSEGEPLLKGIGGWVWDHTGGAIAKGAKNAAGMVWNGVKYVASTVKDVSGKVVDLARSGAANGLEQLLKPIRGMVTSGLDALPGISHDKLPGNMIKGITDKTMDGLIDFVRGRENEGNPNAKPPPADKNPPPPKAGDGAVSTYGGVRLDQYTIRMLQNAEKFMGGKFTYYQGSYSTSVGASGTTHAGGGAVDVKTPYSVAAVKAMRQAGFAAWRRWPGQGDWPYHIHAIAIGDPWMSSSAAAQVSSYRSGGDGLGGKDYLKRGGKSKGIASLLTPGEYVLNKQAVKNIGIRRAYELNAARFNRGGAVGKVTSGPSLASRLSFGIGGSVPHIPSVRTTNMMSAASNNSSTTSKVFAPTINNPIPERASESTSKAMRRKAFDSEWV